MTSGKRPYIRPDIDRTAQLGEPLPEWSKAALGIPVDADARFVPREQHSTPAPAFVQVIAWRPPAPFNTALVDAGELVVETDPDGVVRVRATVIGHPELSGTTRAGDAWDLTQALAQAFGWRLVR